MVEAGNFERLQRDAHGNIDAEWDAQNAKYDIAGELEYRGSGSRCPSFKVLILPG